VHTVFLTRILILLYNRTYIFYDLPSILKRGAYDGAVTQNIYSQLNVLAFIANSESLELPGRDPRYVVQMVGFGKQTLQNNNSITRHTIRYDTR